MKRDNSNSVLDANILLRQIKDDDAMAFAKIVNIYSAELLIKAFRLTKNQDDAEDLVQDLFVDLWDRRKSLTISSSLNAYLYTALKNRFLRKIMRSNLHDNALTHLGKRMSEIEESVSEMLELSEMQNTIATALQLLPVHMQKIFALRDQDYSIREIAAVLGLAEQTVKTYNMQLKRSIKEALVARYPDINHSLLAFVLISLNFN